MRWSCFVLSALLAPMVAAQVTSSFTADAGGWQKSEFNISSSAFAASSAVTFSATGGNPDGHIRQSDTVGTWMTFHAPVDFSGNQSAAIDGELSFDVASTTSLTLNQIPWAVRLSGGGVDLTNQHFFVLGKAFTTYSARLNTLGEWINAATLQPATAAELTTVLTNVTRLSLMADWQSGNDTTLLDNVYLGPVRSFTSTSTFDVDGQGWAIAALDVVAAPIKVTTRPAAPTWSASSGVSGGGISFADVDDYLAYAQAPVSFIGNQLSRSGGMLTFFAKDVGNNAPTDSPSLVVLTGAGKTLHYLPGAAYDYVPINFTEFAVPLQTSPNWHLGTQSGPPPTAAEFNEILSALTNLYIQAEYITGANTTTLDSIAYVAPVVTQVTGTVDLGAEYVGPVEGLLVQVTAYKGIFPMETRNVTLGPGGTFSTSFTSSGTIGVGVKASHWLRSIDPGKTANGGTITASVILLNGDCDGDNIVGTDDYLVLNASFDLSLGDAGFDARADLNGDAYVGTDDYLVLNANFDLQGE